MTTFRQRRYGLRAILSGDRCMRPGSVYDAISVRIAEDLGFEVGMFGGSAASLAILGDPDIALITLTELTEQMRRICSVSSDSVISAISGSPRMASDAADPPNMPTSKPSSSAMRTEIAS